jgi:hypothetical protein
MSGKTIFIFPVLLKRVPGFAANSVAELVRFHLHQLRSAPFFDVTSSCGRQNDTATVAAEEGDTELVFEQTYSCRDVRLNGMELFRRCGDAARAGYRFKHSEIAALHFTPLRTTITPLNPNTLKARARYHFFRYQSSQQTILLDVRTDLNRK